jgi:molybdenum cofactor cytidylyltransferase
MISGIILASGFSKRMGRDKLLMQLNALPIIEKVIQAAIASSLDEVILVYRHESIKAIATPYNIKTIENKDAEKGQSTSVIKGIRAANPATDAFLFMVGDQPFLNADTINHLSACHAKAPNQIIVPTYDGNIGNPVLFPSSFKHNLLNISGDQGGRTIIRETPNRVTYIPIDPPHIGFDVDTIEDFEKLGGR